MTIVNMLANHLWSEADINTRVLALIRSKYSENDELRAARYMRSTPTPETTAFVKAVDDWIVHCINEGKKASKDTALLKEVLDFEAAQNACVQLPPQTEDAGIQDAQDDQQPLVADDAGDVPGLIQGPLAPPPVMVSVEEVSEEVLKWVKLRNPELLDVAEPNRVELNEVMPPPESDTDQTSES